MKKLCALLLSLIMILSLCSFGVADDRVEVEFWYGLGGATGEIVKNTIDEFNAMQDKYTVIGVTKGFEKKLILVGVGYKAEKKGKKLVMNLGYSHPVELEDPEGITTETPDANTVIVKGIDKALVGNYAANIRAWRKPEPYKGKGIKYEDERIRRKEGKTGAGA